MAIKSGLCMYVRFPNWTGIVAEVKKGQLKRGGAAQKELAGGPGL